MHWDRRRRRAAQLMVWAAAGSWALSGCGPEPPPKIAPVLDVRPVRVLLLDAPACQVRVTGPYTIVDAGGTVYLKGEELDWTEVRGEGGLRVGDGAVVAGPLVVETEALLQVGTGSEATQSSGTEPAGAVRAAAACGVINHVDIRRTLRGWCRRSRGRRFTTRRCRPRRWRREPTRSTS
ncbi:MAG: hypothetical protein H6816_13995 [Phycisphaerales bacterium]|nr:hypothetical protein [Phycisphaerales bacterium]